MTPKPVPPPRGGNATPVPPPRRKRPPAPTPPPRTPPQTPPASPFPQYSFPRIYNPAAVEVQAQRAAQNAIEQQLAAGMSALPTVAQQSAPYQQQIASEQGLGSALLDAMKGAQTYRVNLATGVPQAFTQQAAATGGDQGTAAQAAATLASYGTSAANQIAQQEATAPAATAGNIRIINQRLQDLLSGPQGHDALTRQLTSQIEQQRPGLELNYQNAYAQQAQVPFQEALQLATANTNYQLAQQTYGLNAQNAANTAAYQKGQLDIGRANAQTARINTQLRQLGLQIQSTRNQNSYQVALGRLRVQQQNATTAGRSADAAAAKTAQSQLVTAQKQILAQANTLYKRTASTGAKPGTWTVTYYTGGNGLNPTQAHTETFHDQSAAQARAAQIQKMAATNDPATGKPTLDAHNVTTQQTTPPTQGAAGQSLGYLRDQAVNYAVQILATQAPWLPPSARTRMAQQLVAGVFGTQQTPPPHVPTHDTPPGATP